MKKVGILVALALMLSITRGGRAFAQTSNPVNSNTLTIQLNEQNSSGQSGTATLTEQNGQLMVSINLSNGSDTPQPAHIHKGTCANLDPVPAIPLQNVVNGTSTTNIDLSTNSVAKSLNDLMTGQYAINVHKSAAEAKVYVACGDIVNMQMGGGTSGGTSGGTTTPPSTSGMTVQLNEQNGSGQNGTATLTEQNGQLMVAVNLSNGSDTPQPAHIHKGTCANGRPCAALPPQQRS